jgi:hypothetical protein
VLCGRFALQSDSAAYFVPIEDGWATLRSVEEDRLAEFCGRGYCSVGQKNKHHILKHRGKAGK